MHTVQFTITKVVLICLPLAFEVVFLYLHFKQALKFIKGFTVKLQQSVRHFLFSDFVGL